MQLILNSPQYCVVAISDPAEHADGYEIVNKHTRREIYISGAMADSFRDGVAQLIAGDITVEEIEAYLSRFGALMQQPVVLH